MGKYKKPTMVLNYYVEEDGASGRWSGSARNVSRSEEFPNFREFVLESQMAEYAEGHASAFGVSFTETALPFISYSNDILKNVDFSPEYKVDFIYDANESVYLGDDVLTIASLNKYWGQGFEEALIAIKNIKITPNNLTLMSKDKNPTLKISLPNGVDLIKFRSSQEEYEKLCPEPSKAYYITAIGKCAKNEWGGNVTPQILLEEYEINEINYDF